MLIVDLTREEQQILRDILDSYLSDLRMEIVHTDSWQFKVHLKDRKAVIMKMLEVLPTPTAEEGITEGKLRG